MKKGLNYKQKRFCILFLELGNATKAYRLVYSVKTDNSAAAASSLLLRNVKIQDYLNELLENIERTSGINKLRVLNEHAKIAFANITDLQSDWKSLREWDKIPDEKKAAIADIESRTETKEQDDGTKRTDTVIKLKTHSKNSSLTEIAKILGYHANPKQEIELSEKTDYSKYTPDELKQMLLIEKAAKARKDNQTGE